MTKDEYIYWKAERSSDPAEWDYATCVAADKLIKQTALIQLDIKLKSLGVRGPIAEYVTTMAQSMYGYAETGELLDKLGCYPEWR